MHRGDVIDIAAEIRAAILELVGDRSPETLALVDKLDEIARRAKAVPLTNHVRIDREEIFDVLDQLRSTIIPVLVRENRDTGPIAP